jgi:hypothetical protein
LAPGPGVRADQVSAAAAARAAVGLGPRTSEAELRAAQAAHAELLGWLRVSRWANLPAGAPAGEVRATLNKKDGAGDLPIHNAVRDPATGPELVRAMVTAGGEAMLGVLTSGKCLPLHCAALYSPFSAVVALLLARGPAGSARAVTAGGRTPLALADEGPAAAEIRALLRAAMR